MSDLSLESVLSLTQALIQRTSVTPSDAGCQDLLIERLSALGFDCETLSFEDEHGQVTNLWARYGTESPCFVFAGHTDVVPPGDHSAWTSEPFEPAIRDGLLFGRGAADMKSSIAAFMVALESVIAQATPLRGSIALLITSDEEGPATCGTQRVMETLAARDEYIHYCLVGEPSSSLKIADTLKNGRRGSLSCDLIISGTQGHIAYPETAHNPIPDAALAITALSTIKWDQGNEYFQPSSLQFSNINSGTGAGNVIPGQAHIMFNIRFSPELTDDVIRERVETTLDGLSIRYEARWRLFGQPFLTPRGALVSACQSAIESTCGYTATLSTGGGTSDGRFIAPYGAEVVELGPVNASIHKVNEHVSVDDLLPLAMIYRRIILNLLGNEG